MRFDLSFTDSAQKDILRLDNSIKIQVLKKIEKLKENPFLGEYLSNKLKGKLRLHVGKYRVIYLVSEKVIFVVRVRHRKEAYFSN